MNTFEYIKSKYNLENNIKGIEYITALEKEVELLSAHNLDLALDYAYKIIKTQKD